MAGTVVAVELVRDADLAQHPVQLVDLRRRDGLPPCGEGADAVRMRLPVGGMVQSCMLSRGLYEFELSFDPAPRDPRDAYVRAESVKLLLGAP